MWVSLCTLYNADNQVIPLIICANLYVLWVIESAFDSSLFTCVWTNLTFGSEGHVVLSVWSMDLLFTRLVETSIWEQQKNPSVMINRFYWTNYNLRIQSPVIRAISCKRAFFPSPNPGHLMAATFIKPLSLFMTRVASTSCEISSAIINNGTLNWVVFSSNGMMSLMFEIFWSVTRTLAFWNSTIDLSWFVMKWGEI